MRRADNINSSCARWNCKASARCKSRLKSSSKSSRRKGLFAPERKRPLPQYPQRIGLVTSPTGAAIRDVLHVVQRRNPGLEIILAPVPRARRRRGGRNCGSHPAVERFQPEPGAGEPRETKLDLILITRGGGSLEDLWAFNEEIVARAIFESAIPVVSAVGHEIDFTIADFVADVRAATPSAAAEIITEGILSRAGNLSAKRQPAAAGGAARPGLGGGKFGRACGALDAACIPAGDSTNRCSGWTICNPACWRNLKSAARARGLDFGKCGRAVFTRQTLAPVETAARGTVRQLGAPVAFPRAGTSARARLFHHTGTRRPESPARRRPRSKAAAARRRRSRLTDADL